MNIMELGAIGELVGGAAVLVTLIYLAVQVRDSAREQRALSLREATREFGTLIQTVGSDDEKAQIWLNGVHEFATMSPSQRFRFNVVATYLFRHFEQIFYQNRHGRVDQEFWDGFRNQIHDMAGYKGVQDWWATRCHWFGGRFRSFVESHMSPDNQPAVYGEGDTGVHA